MSHKAAKAQRKEAKMGHGPVVANISIDVYQDGHLAVDTGLGIKSLIMMLSKTIFMASQQHLHELAASPVHLPGMVNKAAGN